MANIAPINLVGSYSADIEPQLDGQRTINLYVRNTPGGKTKACLCTMAGLRENPVILAEGTTIRAMYPYKNKIYAVSSNKLYSYDSLLTVVELGTLVTSSGYVGITSNQNQLLLVDGTKGYIYDISTSTFSEITAAGFPLDPTDCAFLDSFFIVIASNSNKFHISEPNDGLSWNAQDFVEIESGSDICIAVRVLHRKLFIFGEKSTEVWYNAGTADFPFRIVNNALLEYGCLAPGSVASGYQMLIWLSGDKNGRGSIFMTEGADPKKISTPAIDLLLQRLSNPTDGHAVIYEIDGHVFYELSFNADNRSIVYDINTDLWLEKQTLEGNRSVISAHAFNWGEHYVGAYNAPKIYTLDPTSYTDDGESITRERITGHFSVPNMQKILIHRLNLDVVAGVGLQGRTEPETEKEDHYDNPEISLSWSKDGGNWFKSEHSQPLGELGDRTRRAIWRSLGSARDWVFKFTITCRSKVFLLGATVEYTIAGK